MTTEQQTLAGVRAEIDALPIEQRDNVLKYADVLRAFLIAQGPLAVMAVALIGAEMAAEE